MLDQKVKDIGSSVSQIVLNISSLVNVENKNLENRTTAIENAISNLVENKNKQLGLLVAKLEKSNPLSILKAGYSKLEKDGKDVSNISQVAVGDTIKNHVSGGEIESTVTSIKEKKS